MLNTLPAWAGNLPVWVLLLSFGSYLGLQWLKNRPTMEQQKIDERLNIKSGYMDRIRALESKVDANWKQCEEEKKELYNQIAMLQDEMYGMRRNHIQEQISLINAIINSIDAPELRVLVKSLESVQMAGRAAVIHSQDETVIRRGKPDGQ